MSFRLGLSPRLSLNLIKPTSSPLSARRFFSQAPPSRTLTLARTQARPNLKLYTLGLGLSFLAFQSLPGRKIQCQSAGTFSSSPGGRPQPEVFGGEPPSSEISLYQLGFGSVAGICTGIFIKKGLKAIAFVLGGAFVLLQYLSSKSFISVDWRRLTGTYNDTFGTKLPTGEVRVPTVGGTWAWFVDFLTANFQQRATFLAGLVLGLRLG